MNAKKTTNRKSTGNNTINNIKQQNEKLKLEYQNEILKKRLIGIRGEYDAVKSNTRRRQPKTERQTESQIYSMRKRMLGSNIGRDLERNYSPAKAIIHQFRVNVVGSLGKLRINISDDKARQAERWFNSSWAKDCDYRDPGIHWSEMLQNILATVKREGDTLIVFDDDIIEKSGKLITWESDQITPLTDAAFQKTKWSKKGLQDNGLIRDKKYGKVLAYICTGKHGMSVIDNKEAVSIFPVDSARLIKKPWRLNQGRGVPDLLTSSADFQDLYEILSKEMQSAKVNAGLAGWAKRKNAVTDWDNPGDAPEYLPENIGKSESAVNAEAANSSDPTATNYEKLEALTGGYFEYIDAEDEVNLADIKRPNIHLAEFLDAVLGYAGSSQGLARAYTLLHADTSYTAFRGDMIMTWATFYELQKWIERMVADWVAQKVLTWAQRKKLIPKLSNNWNQTLSWTWPKMPQVDPLKAENAIKQALKNGSKTYAELLGPDWRQRLKDLAEQIKLIKELELPLGILETASGGEVKGDNDDDADDK